MARKGGGSFASWRISSSIEPSSGSPAREAIERSTISGASTPARGGAGHDSLRLPTLILSADTPEIYTPFVPTALDSARKVGGNAGQSSLSDQRRGACKSKVPKVTGCEQLVRN